MKICIPYDIIYEKNNGKLNAKLAAQFRDGLALGIITDPELGHDDMLCCEVKIPARVKPAEVLAIVNLGGTVEDYPCIIKLPADKLSELVPDGLPYDTSPDIDPLSWDNWHDRLHNWEVYSDVAYIKSDPFGRLFNGAELKSIADVAGVELISTKEFLAVRAAHRPSLDTP